MHLREHSGHARRRRRVRGQKAHGLAEVVEDAGVFVSEPDVGPLVVRGPVVQASG